MEIALVVNNRIENIILADSVAWAVENLGGEWVDLAGLPGVGIGWTRDQDVWSPPEIIVPEIPPRTKLTRLEFRNQFTAGEKDNIYLAAETSRAVRIWLDDLSAAEYIELTDPVTIGSVNGLVSAGLITEARGVEILTAI